MTYLVSWMHNQEHIKGKIYEYSRESKRYRAWVSNKVDSSVVVMSAEGNPAEIYLPYFHTDCTGSIFSWHILLSLLHYPSEFELLATIRKCPMNRSKLRWHMMSFITVQFDSFFFPPTIMMGSLQHDAQAIKEANEHVILINKQSDLLLLIQINSGSVVRCDAEPSHYSNFHPNFAQNSLKDGWVRVETL